MKHSNKVLIITFALSLSLLFLIPAAVTIQYSAERNKPDDTRVYRTLNPFKAMVIKDVSHCLIIPSDSFRIGYPKQIMSHVADRISNDTLTVSVAGVASSDSSEVIVYLPVDKVNLIAAYSSTIRLMGQIRRDETPSYTFELHHTELLLRRNAQRQFYKRLVLDDREHSSLVIAGYNHIEDLTLNNLEKVSFSPYAEISNITTRFDAKANVQLVRTNTKTEMTSRE